MACAEDGKETANNDGPENNPQPQYTTVYVGNLAPEAGTPLYASIILSHHLIHLQQVSCCWQSESTLKYFSVPLLEKKFRMVELYCYKKHFLLIILESTILET